MKDDDAMDVDELMRYTHSLATDLEVRKKTLDEGLQGIDTVRDSYEDSRKLYEAQQQELEEQIQKMHTELDDYKLSNAQDRKSATVIEKQRQQLDLLGKRIRELNTTNSELDNTVRKLQFERASALRRLGQGNEEASGN